VGDAAPHFRALLSREREKLDTKGYGCQTRWRWQRKDENDPSVSISVGGEKTKEDHFLYGTKIKLP
jgi:hypothetical protein